MSNILVFVEHTNGTPNKGSLTGVKFGQQIVDKTGGALFLLTAGPGAQTAAENLKQFGAKSVFVAEAAELEHYLAESYTHVVAEAAKQANASVVAGGSSSTVKDLLPRVAGRLDAAMASEVMEVVDTDTFKRPMWAGNVIATVKLHTPVKVCSVRTTEFDQPEQREGGTEVSPLNVAIDVGSLKTRFVKQQTVTSERPDPTTSDTVVSGGRGVKGPEGFKLIEQLADALGAGVGASRAVCDAGWVPNDMQIGQTGKVVAPNLYIAVGISGAIQHLAGMKGSKTIVAINKDAEAPIFQVADYGLVADLFQAVPDLIEQLKQYQ